MIYCDTSFLLPLYVESDYFHKTAAAIAAKLRESIPYTLLLEMELVHGCRRAWASGLITGAAHSRIHRQVAEDLESGILLRSPLNPNDHFEKARQLSRQHTPPVNARTLDILQVAAAHVLKAKVFYSFDQRQRDLAKASGLSCLPRTLPV